MAYTTKQGFQERFGENELRLLADRNGDGFADTAVIDAAIADADSLIDSYLGERYTLPLDVDTTPPAVVNAAYDIVRYRLYDDRAPEAVRQRYEDALKWLKDIAAGKASLGVADADEPAEEAAVVKSRDQVFTTKTMGYY